MTTFSSNVTKLATGSLVVLALNVLTAPILSRLFAPEAFGIAELFTSIAAFIGSFACFRYEQAIMLPARDEEALNLFGLCILFTILVSVGVAVALLVWQGPLQFLLGVTAPPAYFWLLPLGVATVGALLALTQWCSRSKQFGRLAVGRVVGSGATQGTNLGFGSAGMVSGLVLIAASILGQLALAFLLAKAFWRDARKSLPGAIQWDGIKAGAKRYKKFPLFSSWSALLNSASLQMPPLLLSFYFPSSIVGYYALGKTVLTVPLRVLGAAMAQVFYQKAAVMGHRGDGLDKVVREVFLTLFAVGIFPLTLLAVLGEEVFIVAFGQRWGEAGVYVQMLTPLIFLQLLSSPISTVFNVLEKQEMGLIFNLILFTTRIASLLFGGFMDSPRTAMALLSFTGALSYGVLTYWVLAHSHVSIRSVASKLLTTVSITLAIFTIMELLLFFRVFSSVEKVFVGFAALMIYYSVLICVDKPIRNTLIDLIKTVLAKRNSSSDVS